MRMAVLKDVRPLEPVRDYKARHASTLLTFDAVVDALNQIEAKRGAPEKVGVAPEIKAEK